MRTLLWPTFKKGVFILWDRRFKETFEIEVESFYEKFARHRAAKFSYIGRMRRGAQRRRRNQRKLDKQLRLREQERADTRATTPFTVTKQSDVTVTLESSKDTFLYLRAGFREGRRRLVQ